MTAKNQALFWGGATLALFAFIYIFQSVLTPFVLGLAIAYLLNPLVCGIMKYKIGTLTIPRGLAVAIILIGFLSFMAASLILILPLLYQQALELIQNIPTYSETLLTSLEPYIIKAQSLLGISSTEDLKALAAKHAGTATDIANKLISGLAAGGQAFVSTLTLLIITPLIAYFMMHEWENMTQWMEDLLPRDHKNTIKSLLGQMNTKIAGFVRGQIIVAIILAILYAVSLTIADLKYGFLIGLIAGLLSIIPMVGSVLGLVVSIVVAWFQAGELGYIALIGGIFLAGQIIEGNILSPKIVGDSVGLHPLWIFFALFAGGALFGILGMLIAVPVAAIAGVLLAFAITQYKSSPLYKGKPKPQRLKKKKEAKEKV